MRLAVAHEVGLALCCSAGLAIVLLGGELPTVFWLALLVPALVAAATLGGVVERVSPRVSAAVGIVVGASALLWALRTLLGGGGEQAVLAGGTALVGMLLARLLSRRGPRDDVQALLLSLLLVFSGSVLNVSLSYAGVFLLFSVSAVWALSTRQLTLAAGPQQQDRTDVVTPLFFGATAGVAVLVLSVAAVTFFLFPRLGFGDLGIVFGGGDRLPSDVGLRGDPRAGSGGNRVVARVFGLPREVFERGLYLRATTYDLLSTEGFRQSPLDDDNDRVRRGFAPAPWQGQYEVVAVPGMGNTLFSLGDVVSSRAIAGGRSNPSLPLYVAGQNGHTELKASMRLASALRYAVVGGAAAAGFVPPPRENGPQLKDDDAQVERWRAVPPGLDPRVAALALQVVGDAQSDDEKAARLRAHLLNNFTYTLSQPAAQAREPLLSFLFEARAGHCEYFASAFALLLRQSGIAARVVGGFQGGAYNDVDDGAVVVFQERHAHAWVEWFMPGSGWVTDDATPTATAPREELTGVASLREAVQRFFDDQILDWAFQDQLQAVRDIGGGGADLSGGVRVVAVVVTAAALAAVLGSLLRGRRGGPRLDPLARAILKAVARSGGGPVADSTTLREAVAQAPQHPALLHALHVYERGRFGALPGPTPQERRAALRGLAVVRRQTA